ncbi:hypothetical protein RHGRI_037023 [Rhododendron griersonianum]|uniref:Uncharacterized protein n=1 Tax=Rhododendron griersonianum TaxID=479676 RepID=A0AAV6HT38_9ERIC|nr:hypothetical protein RHGRI_037023 [Rhododendron griersonianum]
MLEFKLVAFIFFLVSQAHCLVVKTGYLSNVYVGNSLISFYCKYSELRYAYEVFDEMPVRNVVSDETAVIAFKCRSHDVVPIARYGNWQIVILDLSHLTKLGARVLEFLVFCFQLSRIQRSVSFSLLIFDVGSRFLVPI